MSDKEIGGFFGLELTSYKNMPQQNGVLLNSCRNSLKYILLAIESSIKKVYIPYYTCHSIAKLLQKLQIPYKEYHITPSLEISTLPKLQSGEYIIANNYFGIKDSYINKLATQFSYSLISDMAQALYAKHTAYSFYSMRKFVGVADGGVAYLPPEVTIPAVNETDESWDASTYLLKRWDLGASATYADCKASGQILVNKALKRISNLTQTLLNSMNFKVIKQIRNKNYLIIHRALGHLNELSISDKGFACPMTYPLLLANGEKLKQKLIDRKIYIPTYWPHIKMTLPPNTFEYYLATNLISIPIDQRYNEADMHQIIDIIKKL
ncbi:MAG: hypothetical protein IJA63_02260 [Akkermansia sp.]|nr:hypothetical protein [Akkermansia sp.]